MDSVWKIVNKILRMSKVQNFHGNLFQFRAPKFKGKQIAKVAPKLKNRLLEIETFLE